jgi:hypothetical protein
VPSQYWCFGDTSEIPNPRERQRPLSKDPLGVIPDGVATHLDHRGSCHGRYLSVVIMIFSKIPRETSTLQEDLELGLEKSWDPTDELSFRGS